MPGSNHPTMEMYRVGVLVGAVQLASAAAYLAIAVYLGGYQRGYPLWDYPTFQIAAGISVLLIASGAVRRNAYPWVYLAPYLAAVSPFFFVMLYLSADDGDLIELWVMFAGSLIGALSTGIFFAKFLNTKGAMSWFSRFSGTLLATKGRI